MRKLIVLLLALTPLAIMCLIFGPMLYGLSGYITSKNLGDYAVAYQIGPQRYTYSPNAYEFAVDRFGSDPHLYLNTGDFDGDYYTQCFAADFLSLAYGDVDTYLTSDNPYFAGYLLKHGEKYCNKRQQYRNASQSTTISEFNNPAGQAIYRYDPTSDNNLYIKNLPIRGKRSSNHLSLRMLTLSERYIDLTELLATQGLKPRWTIDDNSKVIMLSFEKIPPQPAP